MVVNPSETLGSGRNGDTEVWMCLDSAFHVSYPFVPMDSLRETRQSTSCESEIGNRRIISRATRTISAI